MKRFFVVIVSLFFINIISVFSEDNIYDSLLNILRSNNPSAKINMHSINIIKENIKDEQYKWFPKLGVTTEQSFSGFTSHDTPLLSTTDLTVTLVQNLPIGGTLLLFNKQKFDYLNLTPKEFSYGFTAGAKFEFPFLFIVPSLFSELNHSDLYGQQNEILIMNIEQQIFESNLVSTTVQTLGNYYFLKETVEMNNEFKELLKLAEKNEKILWMQGKISTLELSNRRNQRMDKENSITETIFQFETVKENLKLMGVYENYNRLDLEAWVLAWENFLDDFEIKDILITKLDRLKLSNAWNSQIQTYILSIPKFYISGDVTPVSNNEKYKSLSESVSGVFKKNNKINWNVNLGMNINLDPFSNDYSLNKRFKNLKAIQKVKEEELNLTLNMQVIQINNTIKMLDEQIRNANSKLEALKLQNSELENMYLSGYISEVDRKLQSLQLREAELSYKRLRLSKIVYCLRFYTKTSFDYLTNINY